MEYPKELEELFNDPLLADVKPASKPLTADDRLAEKLLCINEYIKRTGHRPLPGGNLEEKKTLSKSGGYTESSFCIFIKKL